MRHHPEPRGAIAHETWILTVCVPGWANVLMTTPAFGATCTTIAKFDPRKYLQIAQETRATHLHIAPPVAVLFAKSPLGKLLPGANTRSAAR